MEKLLKKYKIGSSRIKNGALYGMEPDGEDGLRTKPEESYHAAFLCSLDAGAPDSVWGRFVFDAELPDDMVMIVHALASDESRILRDGEILETDDFLRSPGDARLKMRLFDLSDSLRQEGATDILLYSQRGRYLWLCVELFGIGEAVIRGMRVYTPGDNFFQTFPEVYRRNGDFLHRYLSVFSSMYNDLQEKIDGLPVLFDVDTAPAPLLPVLAGWMGLELDNNLLTGSQCRMLLKRAFRLLSRKGTRYVIEEVVHLLASDPVYILENTNADGQRGFGGGDPFSFTVLIGRKSDEQLYYKLLCLINQFRPMRTRVSIIFLGDCTSMDFHCYMDINAELTESVGGSLDDNTALNGMTYLQ